ncbi:MAG: methyltransferase, partial [Saprospiraceae bacterium]|nr:methyltransferase [Saprospiraceae bacterium]
MTKEIKSGSEYFKFKHFSLRNSNAAFKVNTDGVLLAAWTTLEKGKSCLDIGTGSGVIALILSHRYPTINFSAIDIDPTSYNEAIYNFRLNQKPIKCLLDDFKSFRPKMKYDHFVSNPPYFKSSTLPSSEKKQVSKHQGILDMKNLWSGVS